MLDEPWVQEWLEGSSLTAKQALALEKLLEGNPYDYKTRVKLMSFYIRSSSREDRLNYRRLVLWLIEND
ncbi:hypothetical protein ABTD90_19400, partial [Acinetobacter baumannii]